MGEVFQVAATGLNLREMPDGEAEVLASLPRGHFVTRLDVREYGAGWWRVESDVGALTYRGYVAARFLTPFQPKPQPAAPGSGVTQAHLLQVSPNGDRALCADLAQAFNAELSAHGITAGLRLAHFVAQAAFETGFRFLTEPGEASAFAALEGRRELGNTQPGDGARYRGRGLIRLVGRSAYKAWGAKIGIDLEAAPERAAEPAIATKIACAIWTARELNVHADADDLYALTRRLTGGLAGIEQRMMLLNAAKAIWAAGRLQASQAQAGGETLRLYALVAGKIKAGAKRPVLDAIAPFTGELAKVGITTPLRLQHFWAQVGVESGYFGALEENLNYRTADALRKTFRVFRNGTANPEDYLGNPQKLANLVYANRNGNGGVASGDGWMYRGRGLMQITGRSNYRATGARLGIDLQADPDLAARPDIALKSACAYWDQNRINALADKDDLDAVTVAVNGPAKHGLDLRRALLDKARTIWTQALVS